VTAESRQGRRGDRKTGPEPAAAGPAWVFDVDGCLVDSLTGTSLRPDVRPVLSWLRDHGREVIVWSAGGAEYAREKAVAHGVDHLVTAYRTKADRDADGCYLTACLPADADSAVFVDDRPEDLPAGAVVVAVSPYIAPDPHDDGLRRALARAGYADDFVDLEVPQ
jgi:long-chain acyl-CoA synthetase